MPLYGSALQCRVTTEDPEKNFAPDYGKISTYRSPAGFGIRLDGGTAYAGASLAPYYDSLLVKVTAWGTNLPEACQRMDRALREFRIRGVKTNIPFVENVVNHAKFRAGEVTTSFLDEYPELFQFPEARRSRDEAAVLSRRRDSERQSRSEREADSREPRDRGGSRARRVAEPPAGHAAAAAETGPEEICRVGEKRKATADHRHDVSRRAPVADGHARAHARFAGDGAAPWRTAAESFQPGNVGRRDVRYLAAFSARRSVAAVAGTARSASPIFVFRCCCAGRMRWVTHRIPTM